MVCISSGRIQVGESPADTRVSRTKTFSVGVRTETIKPELRGRKQTAVELRMCTSRALHVLETRCVQYRCNNYMVVGVLQFGGGVPEQYDRLIEGSRLIHSGL